MSKLLSHLPALCNMVRRLACEAGDITLDYFEEGMMLPSDTKADGSPVTEADRKAEEFLAASLRAEFPDLPVVGEEAAAQGAIHDLSAADYFWLVDPLDGTREYIAGSPEFTVNIALIKNNEPILGVIYAPAKGEMFFAHGEGTAAKWIAETGNEKRINVRKPSRGGLVVMASRHRAGKALDDYLAEHKVEKIVRRGSSLKICAVAAGKADIYPGLWETCEWDTAAGHAILSAAGGELVTLDGTPLRYGLNSPHFSNPPFVARSKHLA
ncbi:MAG TPA: 3'(2'),5'-bisphosphate nucleotidase CysQ [Micavibrio sp.]|nr:3'(2'),5'-bisphosphate nucleotidase CysQ [Micavibrio sp.]